MAEIHIEWGGVLLYFFNYGMSMLTKLYDA